MNESSAPIFRDSDAPSRRVYATSTYNAEVRGLAIRVRRTRWRGLGEDIFEEPLENYRAVSMARDSRYEYLLARVPTEFAQVVLVHKFDRERDVILWEEAVTPSRRSAVTSISVAPGSR